MKAILTIILFALFSIANATTYYVSNAGSDANNGTSSATSWQTSTKVNSFSFAQGDSVLFKGGDSIPGTVRIKVANVYAGSYGTGRAIFLLLKKATLTLKSGHLYAATITDAAPNLNTVYVDGTLRIKARYPNNSWLTYNDTTSITDSILQTHLTGTPNYTGFEIVIKPALYIIDTKTVSAQSGGTLSISPKMTYPPIYGGNGFFFQNDSSLCDSNYEWSMQGNRFNIYLPSATDVWYSAHDTGIHIMHVRGVKIENINVIGANVFSVKADTCNALTIQYVSIKSSGKYGIAAQKCDSGYIQNDTIINCLNGFTILRDLFGNHRNNLWQYGHFLNNYQDSAGVYAGMGQSDNNNYIGDYITGHYNVIKYNVVKHTGFNGFTNVGQFDSVYYNWVDSACLIKLDGASYYSWIDANGISTDAGSVFPHDWDSGTVIKFNAFTNPVGGSDGTDLNSIYAGAPASGLYFDANVSMITADSNIIYNTNGFGFNTADGYKIVARGNTIFSIRGSRAWSIHGTHSTCHDMVFKYNILYSGDSAYPDILYRYAGGNIPDVASDSNYLTGIGLNNISYIGNNPYSFSGYTASTGFDAHSGTNPTAARNRTAIFVYNPTLAESTISLNDTYTDVYGTLYFTSVTLHAFESRVLFPATHQFTKSVHFLIPN